MWGYNMAFTLEELMTSVGHSVQTACHAVDLQAALLFYQGFTTSDHGQDGVRKPVTWDLVLPTSSAPEGPEKRVRVPVAALMSHRPLLLHSVDVRIPLVPCENDGTPTYELAGENTSAHAGELSLHFVQGETPEGMARAVQTTTQIL